MSPDLFDLADWTMGKWATLSADGVYRYALWRQWGQSGPTATWIMLNPSTADATNDDPTIRRCISFSKAWGCTGLMVVNLYALRSTNPAGLWSAADPVGPRNDSHLLGLNNCTGPVVAAWGANARPDRVQRLRELIGVPLQCLGTTKAGAPRHPLYVPGATSLRPWGWPL